MDEYMHDQHLMQRYEYRRDRFMDDVRRQQLLSALRPQRSFSVHTMAARLWQYALALRPAPTSPASIPCRAEKRTRKSAI